MCRCSYKRTSFRAGTKPSFATRETYYTQNTLYTQQPSLILLNWALILYIVLGWVCPRDGRTSERKHKYTHAAIERYLITRFLYICVLYYSPRSTNLTIFNVLVRNSVTPWTREVGCKKKNKIKVTLDCVRLKNTSHLRKTVTMCDDEILIIKDLQIRHVIPMYGE